MSQTRVIRVSISAKGRGLTPFGFSFETVAMPDQEALRHHEAMCHAVKAALASGRPPLDFGKVWESLDIKVACAIGEGTLDKAHALAVLHLVRETVRGRDPKLAEKLIPELSEAAEVPAS